MLLPSADAGHWRLSLGSTSNDHRVMDPTLPTAKLEVVAEADPRLSHLRHPGFKLNGPAYNYASALAPILTHTSDVVHIYNFDGELDDQLRLEHLLLVWTGATPLIIIAGERNGGGETLDETEAIVKKLVERPDWLQRIHVIAGTCLKSDTPTCVQRTRRCVESLAEIVKRRSFVWHNNTTITLLAALIAFPIAYQMKAVTTTCSVLFQSSGLGTAFNRKAALRQYETVLHFCKKRNIPFLELQLKLAGWKTDTFAVLPGWAETMCKPVASRKIQQELQQVMHQGMGFAFAVALMAHQSANNLTFEEIRSYAQEILRAYDMQESVWACWPFKSVGMWNGVTLDSAGARFPGMQQNTRMPLTNTIGDVTGAVVDALHLDATMKDRLVILKTHQRYFKNGNEAWRFGNVDSPLSLSLGGHFALVYAPEEETLGKAWKRIQAARNASSASTPSSYQLIDANMIQQWKGFCAVMVPLLQSIQAKVHQFRRTPHSSKLIKQTLHNLKHGEMARICAGHDKPAIPRIIIRSSSASSSQLRSASLSRSSSKTPTAASSRRTSSASKRSNLSSSSSTSLSGRSSQGYKRKRTSRSSGRSQNPIDQETADVTAYLDSL